MRIQIRVRTAHTSKMHSYQVHWYSSGLSPVVAERPLNIRSAFFFPPWFSVNLCFLPTSLPFLPLLISSLLTAVFPRFLAFFRSSFCCSLMLSIYFPDFPASILVLPCVFFGSLFSFHFFLSWPLICCVRFPPSVYSSSFSSSLSFIRPVSPFLISLFPSFSNWSALLISSLFLPPVLPEDNMYKISSFPSVCPYWFLAYSAASSSLHLLLVLLFFLSYDHICLLSISWCPCHLLFLPLCSPFFHSMPPSSFFLLCYSSWFYFCLFNSPFPPVFLLNEISPKLLSIVFFLSFPSLIMYAFISPIVSLFCPVSLTSFNVENWKKKGKKMRISLLLLLCPSFNVLFSFFLSFSLCFSLF